jgi:hypothetical protein
MEGASDQLLAGAPGAVEQHVHVVGGGLGDEPPQLLDRPAPAGEEGRPERR